MAACRHHIIANSSFSWWGAWLGQHEDTITITPDIWYNTTHTPDLFPRQWIKVSTSPSSELLHRLCNDLILRSSYLDSLGLQAGKMGSVLFFSIMHVIQEMSSTKTMLKNCLMKFTMM